MKLITDELAELFCKLPNFLASFADGFESSASIRLNLTEERTLLNIFLQPDEPMVVYSRHAGLTQGAFTSVADSLEKKGLIERHPMKGDRRVNSLILTEFGFATASTLNSAFKDFITLKISNLEPERIRALRDAMRVLIDSAGLLNKTV